jgi:transglutaminase-like putative cysteine protease
MHAPPPMRRGLALTLLALSIALPGAAQSPGPRLHRFIPGDLDLGALPSGVLREPASDDEFRRSTSGTGWSDQQEPNASVLHPRPNWSPVTRGMDLETRSPAGATLRYTEVFSPSIAPFKRTHAFDAVDELGRLTVRDPSLRPMRVGQVPSSWSRERVARFTGDVQLELAAAAPTPIPSVAGDEAVLSFRTEPQVAVGFFRDSAGNLYVRAETSRTVRLSYVLAAPQYAFVAPDGSVPNDLPGATGLRGPEPAPAAPSFLATTYNRVLLHVGARRDQPFSVTLATLIRYFRGFRDADLPAGGDSSAYLRLALGGVGACRHRAYAFVLTLHALGVPARYVGNEAHAWAEVYLSGTGWSRVDLGGWDVNLRDDSRGRERFVPENADPFPRPANYANGYSTYAASASPDDARHRGRHPEGPQNQGLGPDHEANAATAPQPGVGEPRSDGQTSRSTANALQNSPGNGDGTGVGNHGGAASNGAPTRERSDALGLTEGNAAESSPAGDGSLEPVERHSTSLRLLSVQSSEPHGGAVVRGTLVQCEGEARDETASPIGDLPVILELMQGSHVVSLLRNGRRESALGTTVTDARGHFSARVMLPLELEAGTYSIRARTPGDAHHTPARVE